MADKVLFLTATIYGFYMLHFYLRIISAYTISLVKPVKSAIRYMPTAPYELPYEGAKGMLLIDEIDNKEFLTGLFQAMYMELPAPKPKKKK